MPKRRLQIVGRVRGEVLEVAICCLQLTNGTLEILVDTTPLAAIEAYHERLAERPAFQRALDPSPLDDAPA